MTSFGVGKVYRIWTPKGGPPQYPLGYPHSQGYHYNCYYPHLTAKVAV